MRAQSSIELSKMEAWPYVNLCFFLLVFKQTSPVDNYPYFASNERISEARSEGTLSIYMCVKRKGNFNLPWFENLQHFDSYFDRKLVTKRLQYFIYFGFLGGSVEISSYRSLDIQCCLEWLEVA